jgi:hypothetical protein
MVKMVLLFTVAGVLLFAACSRGDSSRHSEGTGTGTTATEPGGSTSTGPDLTGDRPCTPASIRRASPPAWTKVADLPADMPYAIADDGNVAAFFFGFPVRVGPASPGEPRNKVLWVVRVPGTPGALVIEARSKIDPAHVVRIPSDTGGGSGEIQRSTIDLPVTGCWRLHLRWAMNEATLDVEVEDRT